MEDQVSDRRRFLKSAIAGSAAAAVGIPNKSEAQAPGAGTAPAKPPPAAGYAYLNPEEQAFVEALVDHMIPADSNSPKGTDVGINIYIDRACAGSWGKGDRLYQSGPWKLGAPSQGYQLPLTPAELYRAGIAATNRYSVKTYGKSFDRITPEQREQLLTGLADGKIALENGPPAAVFFGVVYQTVMEGMFADPIYGGNRDKAGWRMVGFPGVIATHQRNIVTYKNKRYPVEPLGIADVS